MKKLVSKILSIAVTAVITLTMFPGVISVSAAEADDIINIKVSGTENYDYAFEVLDQVNELRASQGISPFQMDKSLLEIAMKRAAEISIYYSHTRPDGTGGWSENIAGRGDSTPTDVMIGWINSEGHYNNIMSHYPDDNGVDPMESIGVGCFKDCQGKYWWVQVFEGFPSKNVITKLDKSGTFEVSYEIPAQKSLLGIDQWTLNTVSDNHEQDQYYFGKNPDSGKAEVRRTSTETGTQVIDPSNFTFTSSNRSVVNIDSQTGEYTITGVGIAVLKATLNEDPSLLFEKVITVEPKDISIYETSFSLEQYTYIYDGTPKTPKVQNSLGLTEGVDYTVKYENNINVAVGKDRGKVIITGIDNYKGSFELRFFIRNCENHEFETTKIIAPDCTNDGIEEYTCKLCGYIESKSIPAVGHKYGEWKITKNATCTETGTKVKTCSVCNNVVSETISATGHKYATSWTIDKTATCTDEGSKSHHCISCGAKKDITVIPKTNHKYVTTVIKAATCTENGTNKITCSDCGESHTESVPAKGHNYTTKVVNPSYTAQGYVLHECIECGSSYKDNYKDKLVLANVTGFKAASTNASAIKLTWNKVSNADGYIVYRYNTSTKKYGRIAKGGNLAYTDKNLKAGTSYKYAIRSYKTVNGKELLSPSYPEITATTNPANVTGFKAASTNASAIKLTWNKVSSADGYVVYRYNTSTKKYGRIAKGGNLSFTDKKLKAGTSYKYAIRSYKIVNGKEILSPSYPEITATTNPANVTGFKAASTNASAIKLTWNKVSSADGYVVYRYNTSTKKYGRIAKGGNLSFTDKNLKAGTSYKYAIRSYKTVNGKEILSPSYPEITVSTNPATVNFTVTAGSKNATVKWSKVTGATGYKVYYKTSANGKWIGLKTTNNATTSYTKTGLTKGKTYYFTVKAYRTVNGKTYNGTYKAKSVKVK